MSTICPSIALRCPANSDNSANNCSSRSLGRTTSATDVAGVDMPPSWQTAPTEPGARMLRAVGHADGAEDEFGGGVEGQRGAGQPRQDVLRDVFLVMKRQLARKPRVYLGDVHIEGQAGRRQFGSDRSGLRRVEA